MHQRSKTNMLSKLKFDGKVLSSIVTGKKRFSLKYLYEYELRHITITLIKGHFIMPKFRKAVKGANFDFFSFKKDDSLIPKEIKEIIEPSRHQLAISEKEIDHKKCK